MAEGKPAAAVAAAERIRQAALSASKGLSRAQAERAAAAATRNVNAYGQKEEGPSRWQERKELKQRMYLESTEQAARLGVRVDRVLPGSGAQQCQKCFKLGHWTYECKNERVYVARPTRTQQLKNPKLRARLDPAEVPEDIVAATEHNFLRDRGSVEVERLRREQEVKEREKREKEKRKGGSKGKGRVSEKRKDSSSSEESESESGSESESDKHSGSASESDSGSGSDSKSQSGSGSESGTDSSRSSSTSRSRSRSSGTGDSEGSSGKRSDSRSSSSGGTESSESESESESPSGTSGSDRGARRKRSVKGQGSRHDVRPKKGLKRGHPSDSASGSESPSASETESEESREHSKHKKQKQKSR